MMKSYFMLWESYQTPEYSLYRRNVKFSNVKSASTHCRHCACKRTLTLVFSWQLEKRRRNKNWGSRRHEGEPEDMLLLRSQEGVHLHSLLLWCERYLQFTCISPHKLYTWHTKCLYCVFPEGKDVLRAKQCNSVINNVSSTLLSFALPFGRSRLSQYPSTWRLKIFIFRDFSTAHCGVIKFIMMHKCQKYEQLVKYKQ